MTLDRESINIAKEIWNTFGLPTIIIALMFMLYVGFIPSPLVEANGLIVKHIETVQRHIDNDAEIIFYLKSMCISNAKIANTPVEECLWRNR